MCSTTSATSFSSVKPVVMSAQTLHEACIRGDREAVENLLHGGVDENAVYRGDTPLLVAVIFNHPSVVSVLLARPGTMLGWVDEYGRTALHYACQKNRPDIVELLGRDKRCTPALLNKKDMCGYTPLWVAVKTNSLDSVKELGKLEWTNFRTETQTVSLIAMARKRENYEILKYLLERNKTVKTLAEMAAFIVAKRVAKEDNVNSLDIPISLHSLMTKFQHS